jgi:hypothetical protein
VVSTLEAMSTDGALLSTVMVMGWVVVWTLPAQSAASASST